MKHFHAHIYFENKNLHKAIELTEKFKNLGIFKFAGLSQKPIGPHPLGMIELHFFETNDQSAIQWLNQYRDDFSILIHPETGDDLKDHTEGVVWLGLELPLNFSFFELIKKHPALRIHK